MEGIPASSELEKPTRLWRNGMDFEPKKTYPPDYSNVPSVRDWQMSPFSNERFDLDEIQRAEKKGYKGRFELDRLKKLYSSEKEDSTSSRLPCPDCSEREAAEKRERTEKKLKCSTEYLYQPYGPTIVSSLSYSRPESNKPRLYSYMGPSFYSGFRFKTPAPEMVSPIPCLDSPFEAPKRVFTNVYVPYGPYGEIRMTPDMYTPMGPSIV